MQQILPQLHRKEARQQQLLSWWISGEARVFRMDILQATKLGPKSQAPKRGGGKRSEKRCSECDDHQNLSMRSRVLLTCL